MGNGLLDLHDIYHNIKNDKIVFCYCGPISQATIEGIGNTLRLDLEIEDTKMNISQSIFSVFIEQMQNILNYSAEKISKYTEIEKELRVGVLVICQEIDDFYIYCGNKIYCEDIEKIKYKIDELKCLDKGQLKNLYKERRKNETLEGSKGAGLGLIEMARKSQKPIEYSFKKLDDKFAFFTIKVTVLGR